MKLGGRTIIGYSVFISILFFSFAIGIAARGMRVKTVEISLYFVDAEMMRLIPIKTTIPEMDKEKTAQRVVNELIRGRDDNPKIRRLIPDIKRCMTVKVEDDTAYVDLKKEFVENHPEGRDQEILTVYSIVNSLTGIDGITNVRFTICGERQKDLMGYLDMRETFVADHFV